MRFRFVYSVDGSDPWSSLSYFSQFFVLIYLGSQCFHKGSCIGRSHHNSSPSDYVGYNSLRIFFIIIRAREVFISLRSTRMSHGVEENTALLM